MTDHAAASRPSPETGATAVRQLNLDRVFAVVSPLLLLVGWELMSRTGILDVRIFSSPTRVLSLGWELTRDGTLISAVVTTTRRLIIGLAVGIIPGTLIGITMGLFALPRAILNPLVKALYPLPRVALFPLVILLLGRGEMSFTFMVALGPFFAMVVGAMGGVLNVDPIYLKVAKSFKTSTRDLYRRVVFPAALPIIFSSFRIALGLGLVGVVAVEFLLASDGLGFLIWRSWEVLSLGQSMVGLVATGALGFGIYALTDLVEKRAVPWAVVDS